MSQFSQDGEAVMLSGNLPEQNQPNLKPKFGVVPLIWLVIVAVLANFLYTVNRRGAFLADDYIVLNQLTFTHTTFFDNLSWFGRDWGVGVQFYRPWVRLFYYFQFLFFGDNAAGWHLFSALLQVINTALVYLLAWRMSRRLAIGVVAGLTFALLPIHTEPVSWISGQSDLWATLFVLSSLLCWSLFRGRKEGGRKWYIAALVLFGLGLCSKEVVLAFPAALLAYDFVTGGIDRIWHHETPQPGVVKRLLIAHGPFWGLLVAYLGLRLVLFQGLGGYVPEPGQKVDFGLFISSNVNWLIHPFSLSGTSGLVLIGLILAFTGLLGVQEWERFRLQNGLPLDHSEDRRETQPRAINTDDELDDPNQPLTPEVKEEIAPPPPPEVHDDFPPPPYYGLRAAGFGLMVTAIFLLPTLLTPPAERFTYLPSAGFTIFLGAILAPFSRLRFAPPHRAAFLDGIFDLGLWLRIIAIIALLSTYAATSNARIQQWLDAGNTARQILKLTKDVIPGVPNYARFISEGVPESNGGALIFRTGYNDAIQLLYKNRSIDAEKVERIPVVQDRLKTTILLEYKGERLINHTEILGVLDKRNQALKQQKSFLIWDFTLGTTQTASGAWFETTGTGSLVVREEGLALNGSNKVTLQSPDYTLPAVQLGPVIFTMKANNKGRAFRGEVMWYAGGSAPDKTAQATVGFDIIADGEYHTYTVTPEVARNFAYADQIARTRLNVPAGVDGIIISKIEQTQLPTEYTSPSK